MTTDYYKSKESVKEYIRLAKDVNGGELIDKLKRFLPPKSTVLEVGSGPGTDWKILSGIYEVTGSDFSEGFLDHLFTNHKAGRFLQLDAVSLRTKERFDGIYSNKVLHHLKDSELVKSINRQYDILNPEGVICHSFWRGTDSETFNGMFVNYHSEADLRIFFEKHFDVLLLERYAEFEPDDSLLLIGKKKS